MANLLPIEALEARLAEINQERDLLMQLIAIRKGETPSAGGKRELYTVSSPRPNNTIRGRVIDATIELIHKLGRNVSNAEVLEFVDEKKISLGNASDKVRAVGAILSQETAKKTGRIKNVARGVYDIK